MSESGCVPQTAKAEKEYLQILEKERGILNKQFKDCARLKSEKEYLQILEKERGILNKQFKDCARYFEYIVPDYSCGSLRQLILKYDTRIGFSERRLFQHHQDLGWLDVQRDMTREQYEACTYRRVPGGPTHVHVEVDSLHNTTYGTLHCRCKPPQRCPHFLSTL
uniref:Uncharacterized protein n=1 Tax=Branchiostoma floridae TaxID=7739 RepID=C3YG25_BRAFL|eukprot:XP_002604820.1 hypothetical protein BRAFLDRAFT_119485 [Branchiostoma floridae]